MNKNASTYDVFFKRIPGHEPKYCLNAAITAEAHTFSIDKWYIFGIFEKKDKNTETHSQAEKILIVIPVQKKITPTILKPCITPEPWNRQQ